MLLGDIYSTLLKEVCFKNFRQHYDYLMTLNNSYQVIDMPVYAVIKVLHKIYFNSYFLLMNHISKTLTALLSLSHYYSSKINYCLKLFI